MTWRFHMIGAALCFIANRRKSLMIEHMNSSISYSHKIRSKSGNCP